MKNPTKEDIQKQIDLFTQEQNWMHNIGLTHGLFTVKEHKYHLSIDDTQALKAKKIERLQRGGTKEGLLCALELQGKLVLDVACGEGKYSFAIADKAVSVLGFDIDETRIRKANYIKSLSPMNHVKFDTIDLYSPDFEALPTYDLALCFGLLHRLPDPFNVINVLAAKSRSILFEWIVAPALMDQNVPWAFHNQGGLYEWQNAKGNFESKDVASKGRAGGGVNRASYWNMSFAAIETMCQRAGLGHFLRFSRQDGYPDLSDQPAELSRRVMLLASSEPTTVLGRTSREGLVRWSRQRAIDSAIKGAEASANPNPT